MAERAFITRATLLKAERGDPAVSLGIYATILFILGMTNRLADLADVPVGCLHVVSHQVGPGSRSGQPDIAAMVPRIPLGP